MGGTKKQRKNTKTYGLKCSQAAQTCRCAPCNCNFHNINYKTMKKLNVSQAIQIGKRYGYKCHFYNVGSERAYLLFNSPFFKSPFPEHYFTKTVTKKYAKLMFNIYNE